MKPQANCLNESAFMAIPEKILKDKFRVCIVYFQNYKEMMVSVHFVLLLDEQEAHSGEGGRQSNAKAPQNTNTLVSSPRQEKRRRYLENLSTPCSNQKLHFNF